MECVVTTFCILVEPNGEVLWELAVQASSLSVGGIIGSFRMESRSYGAHSWFSTIFLSSFLDETCKGAVKIDGCRTAEWHFIQFNSC